jgi:hypothetical protein
VVVTAAQTVLHGGPAALLAATGAETQRAAVAESLLETHLAPGWELALALERAIGARVPLIGASLTLDLPRLAGTLRGYPYDPDAVARIAGSRLARASASSRRRYGRFLSSLPFRLTASAAYAARPQSPAERSSQRGPGRQRSTSRSARSAGDPQTTAVATRAPDARVRDARARLALRLWRGAFPVREGGTAILVSPLRAPLRAPATRAHHAFFRRRARAAIGRARRGRRRGGSDRGRSTPTGEAARATLGCLSPTGMSTGCPRPPPGAVLVAGCRDATAASSGFVPIHEVPGR